MPKVSKLLIILTILLLPILLIAGNELRYINAAYPNIYIGEVAVGGKSKNEVEKIIQQEASIRENKTLSFSINKSTYLSVQLNKDILTYDTIKTVNEVMSYGKTGSLQERFTKRINLVNQKHTITPAYTFDNLTFDTILADTIRPYEKPVIETQLIYAPTTGPVLTPSKPGIEINRDTVLSKLTKEFEFEGTTGVIELQLQDKEPKMTRENSQGILELAKRAVSRPITLFSSQIPDQTWTLEAPQIYDFLEIKYDEDRKEPVLSLADYKVASYAAQFETRIHKDVKEAKYETAGSKIIVIAESEDGRELDTEKLTAALTEAVFSASQDNRIDLPIKTIKPALAFNTINQYGIKEIIATGKSHFKGSSAARIHNIETAAQKLNGTLIKPGEVFSMYKAVGNIEKSTGFEDSYVIKNGRTVVGVGGGVCQVSTTLFRAALNAGFKINERHPHSYRVGYYEQDSSPGFDAAIFFPQADFKFTNNTGNYALIQTKVDKENWELTFNFYGVNDGRTVDIGQAEIKNRREPPKELRILDASIPKGIMRQTEFAAQGADITFNRKVTKDGTVSTDTFNSHYYPWQAVIHIGAKEN